MKDQLHEQTVFIKFNWNKAQDLRYSKNEAWLKGLTIYSFKRNPVSCPGVRIVESRVILNKQGGQSSVLTGVL